MSGSHLLAEVHVSAPCRLLVSDASVATELATRWQRDGLTVRVLRGHRMRTVDALFDEVSAALQFPAYFGCNWSAFDECLGDMEWFAPTAGLVVVVSEAEKVLAEETVVERSIFVRAVNHAAATYAAPIERGEWWDRPAVPFHIVFCATTANAPQVVDYWRAAGAESLDPID